MGRHHDGGIGAGVGAVGGQRGIITRTPVCLVLDTRYCSERLGGYPLMSTCMQISKRTLKSTSAFIEFLTIRFQLSVKPLNAVG